MHIHKLMSFEGKVTYLGLERYIAMFNEPMNTKRKRTRGDFGVSKVEAKSGSVTARHCHILEGQTAAAPKIKINFLGTIISF